MKNQAIKVLSEEHGVKVIEYFKGLGINTKGCKGSDVGYYYGLFDGMFGSNYQPYDSEVITLPEETVYPKIVYVWSATERKIPRVVFDYKCGKLEDVKNTLGIRFYSFAEDITEPEEMTLEQVCKELGREIKIVR